MTIKFKNGKYHFQIKALHNKIFNVEMWSDGEDVWVFDEGMTRPARIDGIGTIIKNNGSPYHWLHNVTEKERQELLAFMALHNL